VHLNVFPAGTTGVSARAGSAVRRNAKVAIASDELPSSLEEVAAAVPDAVLKGICARHAALLAGGKLEGARGISAEEMGIWLAAWKSPAAGPSGWDRRDPLSPVRVPLDAEGHGRVGWLLPGSRPDGSLSGKDERQALAEIADCVARGISTVRSREERETRQEGRLAGFNERLYALETLLKGMTGGRSGRGD
jgi:hypothetical protein